MDLGGVGEIGLRESHAASEGFDLRLSLQRRLGRLVVMQHDVKSLPRQSQGEDVPQTVCRTRNEGKRGHGMILMVKQGKR